jgi:hypothetical protein
MMNRSLLTILLFTAPLLASAQSFSTTFNIRTYQADHKTISPYIYGTNGQSNDALINATSRRLGGNRLTGYNWENNCSNAGKDYINSSDLYLVPSGSNPDTPAVVMTEFHKASLAINAYTLQTLQMAGYVARDHNGSVADGSTPGLPSQVAPSFRWKHVQNVKGSSFTLHPDTSDAYVYMDELVNFLVTKYGKANTLTGIKGYSLDNEPALWSSTHPLIHPSAAGCSEELNKSVALAKAVKAVDPSAEIFGPVFYGYSDLSSFQCPSSDWSNFGTTYSNYVEAYLGEMAGASSTASKRLLDVLDVHWYPEARGKCNVPGNCPNPNPPDAGSLRVIDGSAQSTDTAVATARMQCPRSLWDPTYKEVSWLNNYGSKPLNLIAGWLNPAIKIHYPGTKLSFTEYDFGGHNHISGGIAQADVFGIFAEQGVYMGNIWASVSGYLTSAFKLYRDYDGKKSTYGSVRVKATTTDIVNSSAYASINSATDSSQLHLIVLNKDSYNSMSGTFNLTTNQVYKSVRIYSFDSLSSSIKYRDSITIPANVYYFNYKLPKLTAAHFVIGTDDVIGNMIAGLNSVSLSSAKFISVYPNPFDNSAVVEFNIPSSAHVIMELMDILGRKIRTVTDQKMNEGNHSVVIEKNGLPSGIYFCKLSVDGQAAITKLIVN